MELIPAPAFDHRREGAGGSQPAADTAPRFLEFSDELADKGFIVTSTRELINWARTGSPIWMTLGPAGCPVQVMAAGEAGARAVGEDGYAARDGRDRSEVDYEPLGPRLDPRAAAGPDAPLLRAEVGSNVVMRTAAGAGDVDGAFAAAGHVVRASFEVPRLAAVPMECRATLAEYDADSDTLTMWTSTQVPHRVKTYLASLLPEAPGHIRVIAPDVGGGFGRKIEVWPEEVAVAYLAQQLGRPVKWAEDRSENIVTGHGRGYTADVEAAVASDGRVLGMRFRMLADLGAYFLTSTGGPPGNAVQRVAGP